MSETIRWLIVSEVIGLAAFPIAYAAFPSLKDRGWGLAKPLGLVLFSFVVWLTSYAPIIESTATTYWVVTAVAAIFGWRYMAGRWSIVLRYVKGEWRAIAAVEILFLIFFFAWVAYRSYDPSISGTEKPMDFLFLNASTNATNAPPQDPWLAGSSVAYYYFGYWMLGGLTQMASVPTFISFNLSIALIAALSAGAVFSLTYNMVRSDRARQARAIGVGVLASVLLLVAANSIGVWEIGSLTGVGTEKVYDWVDIDRVEPAQNGNNWRPTDFWWWWHASRVINSYGDSGDQLDFTIQEFPFFSLLLGDLHPHLMSIPFVLLALAFLFQMLLSRDQFTLGWMAGNKLRVLLLAIVIGALGFINAWDIATLGSLLFIVVTIRAWRSNQGNLARAIIAAVPPSLLVGIAAIALYSPFYLGSFSSQVSPGAPIGAVVHSTRYVHFFTVWALPLLLVAPMFVATARRPVVAVATWIIDPLRPSFRGTGGAPNADGLSATASWIIAALITAPFVVWAVVYLIVNDDSLFRDIPQRFIDVLPLALASTAAMFVILWRARRGASDGQLFAIVLVGLSVYMMYGVELIFVRDLFNTRMNTVFKAYYQIWIFMAVAGAYGAHYWTSRQSTWKWSARVLSKSVAGVAAVLIVVAMYYPVAAAFSKSNGFSAEPTLDGLSFINASSQPEREAIKWISENTGVDDRLVEAVGGSYSEFGRISSATGRATVLGWEGHEHQWRGTREPFEGRAADIETLYKTDDVTNAKALLDRYDIEYVYLGARERGEYGPANFEKFDELGERVFEFDSTMIFRIFGARE
ncbi:MAG: hypothetical protein HQ478_09950 [Chloroflexi bacterium]|nr:hypothetical protein [Chloroflexota bacterium]